MCLSSRTGLSNVLSNGRLDWENIPRTPIQTKVTLFGSPKRLSKELKVLSEFQIILDIKSNHYFATGGRSDRVHMEGLDDFLVAWIRVKSNKQTCNKHVVTWKVTQKCGHFLHLVWIKAQTFWIIAVIIYIKIHCRLENGFKNTILLGVSTSQPLFSCNVFILRRTLHWSRIIWQ